MPDALLLDLGRVLVRFDHMDTCRWLAPETGLDPEEVFQRLFLSGLERRFDRGELPEADFLARACERLGLPGDRVPRVRRAWAEIFHRDERNLSLLEPLSRRYRLVLVSNTNVTHLRYIQGIAPELAHFHARAVSYQVGAAKPEPALFQAAISGAGVPAGACLFVDDSPEYVAAAEALGIPGRVHQPGAALADTLGEEIVDGACAPGRRDPSFRGHQRDEEETP